MSFEFLLLTLFVFYSSWLYCKWNCFLNFILEWSLQMKLISIYWCYPITSLNLFINYSRFVVDDSLYFISTYRIMSEDKGSFTSSYQIWYYKFFSFSIFPSFSLYLKGRYVIQARTHSIMLNRSVESLNTSSTFFHRTSC